MMNQSKNNGITVVTLVIIIFAVIMFLSFAGFVLSVFKEVYDDNHVIDSDMYIDDVKLDDYVKDLIEKNYDDKCSITTPARDNYQTKSYAKTELKCEKTEDYPVYVTYTEYNKERDFTSNYASIILNDDLINYISDGLANYIGSDFYIDRSGYGYNIEVNVDVKTIDDYLEEVHYNEINFIIIARDKYFRDIDQIKDISKYIDNKIGFYEYYIYFLEDKYFDEEQLYYLTINTDDIIANRYFLIKNSVDGIEYEYYKLIDKRYTKVEFN